MDDQELQELIKERFSQLPTVVQRAVVSTDVEKHLRTLAETNKLHLDQWKSLEDVVQQTLLGIMHSEELEENLQNEVGVTEEVAASLAAEISQVVFEPIRQELERQLEHPDARTVAESDVEAVRTQVLEGARENVPAQPSQPIIAPATPPMPPPQASVTRGPASGNYKPGESSTERNTVVDDPYRELPV